MAVFKKVLQHVQLLEEEAYDIEKIFNSQMLIRQLMNLKTKGRFLEETKIFEY